MKLKRKYKLLLLLIGIIIVSVFVHIQEREHHFWTLQQKLSNGNDINIQIDESWKKRVSFPPHPLTWWSIGGGDFRKDISFSYDGKSYFYRSSDEIVRNPVESDH